MTNTTETKKVRNTTEAKEVRNTTEMRLLTADEIETASGGGNGISYSPGGNQGSDGSWQENNKPY
jgi:hypothetical protein